jgi:hypothetical protein
MRKWLILLSALLGTPASSAPAWTWVDANGTVHFSDRPVPGARQLELGGAQPVGSVPPPAVRSTPRATTRPGDSARVEYQIEIVSPAEQETLWNTGGTLSVELRSSPGLQPGHRYDLVLDGQRRNLNTTSSRVDLTNIFRGTHTLQVAVIDAAGMELARSASRTFFVQQTSVLNPNSANARPRAGAN